MVAEPVNKTKLQVIVVARNAINGPVDLHNVAMTVPLVAALVVNRAIIVKFFNVPFLGALQAKAFLSSSLTKGNKTSLTLLFPNPSNNALPTCPPIVDITVESNS